MSTTHLTALDDHDAYSHTGDTVHVGGTTYAVDTDEEIAAVKALLAEDGISVATVYRGACPDRVATSLVIVAADIDPEVTAEAERDLETYRGEFPASDLDEPWFTAAFGDSDIASWPLYWREVLRLDAEHDVSRFVVVGPDWGSGSWTTEESAAACERATAWLREHEGDHVEITFRTAQRGEISATYPRREDGSLGTASTVAEEIDELVAGAYQHALETWPATETDR